jgi:hypothetical protein
VHRNTANNMRKIVDPEISILKISGLMLLPWTCPLENLQLFLDAFSI